MPDDAAVLALAVLAVLAGCNALPSGGSSPTFTPAPVPDTTRTPAPDAGFAPGVTASGQVDPARLTGAHVAALTGASYAVNQTIRRQYANGTLIRLYTTRVRFAADASHFRETQRQVDRGDGGLRSRRVERYGDGSRLFEAVTENGTTAYGLVRSPDGTPRDPSSAHPWNLTNGRQVRRLFSLVETRATERFAKDGTGYIRLETVEPATLGPLENVTVTAVVSERGIVRSYLVRYDFQAERERIEALVAVRYDGVGSTTVQRPAWITRVTNTTASGAD